MSWLARILEQKRRDLARLETLALPTPPARRPVALARASGAPLALIAEIKRRSPSAGELSTRLSVSERARAYERAGARVVSVLTDESFFAGSLWHLEQARQGSALPILCKDFIIHESQLDAARAFGADLALVIVRCLEPSRVRELVSAARARELEPLVEVTTLEESRIALDAGAELVGVNARDLDTLELDQERAARVLAALPAGVVALHLSGISRAEDVLGVARSRADAALIGEALMRLDDPEPLLRQMVASAAG